MTYCAKNICRLQLEMHCLTTIPLSSTVLSKFLITDKRPREEIAADAIVFTHLHRMSLLKTYKNSDPAKSVFLVGYCTFHI